MQEVRFDLSAFGLSETARCGARLREAVRTTDSPATAAQRIADFLYDSLRDGHDGPACGAVGVFVIDAPDASGDPTGNGPRYALEGYRGPHPARPGGPAGSDALDPPALASGTAHETPALHRLLERLAVTAQDAQDTDGSAPPDGTGPAVRVSDLQPDELEDALPERDVRRALAYGGTLSPGRRYAVVLLCRVPLPDGTAALFRTIAGSTRLALLSGHPAAPAVRADAVRALLADLEHLTGERAAELQTVVTELRSAATELRRSQRELQQRERELSEEAAIVELLQEVGSGLAAELDLDALVQHAVDAATRLAGAAFGAFFYNVLGETGESYLLYVISGVDRSAFDKFPMPRNTQVFEPTFRGLGVVRSEDITADPRYGHNAPHHGMPEGHLPVRSYLAVPVMARGTVLGGFFFGHPDPGVFTERHERLITGVAAQTAVALQNAQTYRQEREAAMELQRHLLPRLPRVDGIASTSRYLPAARDRGAGGDWVDLIPLADGALALVVGDAMGKGVRAAAVMGQIRTACRAYAQLGLAPAEVLEQLSVLLDDIAPGSIATCVYAVLDTRRDRLRLAVAGHLPPVRRDPGGSARFLDERVGPPLGVGRRPYQEQDVALPPGSRLLLYTDGLVERRGRPIDEGLRLLRELVAGPVGEIEADCDSWLNALADGEHDDDIAMLYLHRPEDAAQQAAVAREYAPVSGAVPDARDLVSRTMREWGLRHLVNDMMLIADEMVANAVRHARTPLRVELRRSGERVVLEVTDSSTEEPRLIVSQPGEFGHRGIFLVDAIATRWGTRPIDGGKVVWAEVKAS
ncbi:ATP-binding SpoIIE family protein phosphatase [Streptomyces fumanus]|uniref:ATP-binding SpoIIE family protein phosphatase n=1 Tax=Streptomyces fumanus TaxID=67302 RepID=UPI00167D2623|nr:SpoIIE family protein phosphatase [Streptomyces fumanus]